MSPSRAPVFSCAHYFQAPAMQATMHGSEELNDNGKSHSQTPSYEIPHYHIIALSLVKQNPYIFYLFKFIYLFINLFTSFPGHRPSQREWARTELRSHARCHPYSIPQSVKVGHTTGV